jgi:hypothetical protein
MQNYSKKKWILFKKIPLCSPQKYKALSTSKKDSKKWWNRQLAQLPKKSVLNISLNW